MPVAKASGGYSFSAFLLDFVDGKYSTGTACNPEWRAGQDCARRQVSKFGQRKGRVDLQRRAAEAANSARPRGEATHPIVDFGRGARPIDARIVLS